MAVVKQTKKKLGTIKALKRTWTVFLVDRIPSGVWGLTDFYRHYIFIPFFDEGKIEKGRFIGKQRLKHVIRHEVIHALMERILPEARLDDRKGLVCLDDDITEAISTLLEFWPENQVSQIIEKAWKEVREIKKKYRPRL